MLRAYRYRIYPTPDQTVKLAKTFGCCRWVYNWALAEKTARYAEAGIGVSIYEVQTHLPELKERKDTAWLSEAPAAALQSSLHHLDAAYTAFFKGDAAFPQFKKRGHHDSFQLPQKTKIHWDRQTIQIIGFREGIQAALSRRFEGKIKTTTVSRTPTDKHYISILVETPEPEPAPLPADEAKALGLDFGLKDLVVTSDGQRFVNPKALKRYLRRLKIRQRHLSRKVKGSKNRNKARLRVALTHERITFIRNDNLHKISSTLVRKNQATTFCLEDLSVASMVTDSKKSRALNRSIGDAGWRELRRQIEYKARWASKNVRVIGRFEPSSKTCSCCGHIKTDLTLAERSWTCVCGATHDRDINAAINIKRFAFCEQNTSSEALASESYRQARRKVTPEEQPVRVAESRECHASVLSD